jgi:hypothetical protein
MMEDLFSLPGLQITKESQVNSALADIHQGSFIICSCLPARVVTDHAPGTLYCKTDNEHA